MNFKDDADNVRYDEATKKVYVGFGSGGIAVVNAPDGKQIGSMKLWAHPEAFELEKNGRRIFVNVPNSRHVAVIDRDKGEVIARWQTDLTFGNFPMALDAANHRLFIGCRFRPSSSCSTQTRAMLWQRSTSPAIRTRSSTTPTTIESTQSAALERLTSSTRLIRIPMPSQRRSIPETALALGFLYPERHALFVAIPHRGSQDAEIREYEIE